MKQPKIYFYLPENEQPAGKIPTNIDDYWSWTIGQDVKYKGGKYDWTVQTYIYLKADGFPCELIGKLPEEGIVVTHHGFLPFHLQLSPKLLYVCIQADRPKHPYAHINIVQNQQDEKLTRPRTLWESYYIPFWPQPSLIPRDPARGDKFENVAYFGSGANLAPELLRDKSWQEQLKVMGLNWIYKNRDRENGWNDYSDVDAVIGVRSFNYQGSYSWKPASKLVNAWHAGVPAILSRESAYQAERKSELDYIEVTSLEELFAALERLRDDKNLRQAMMENGRIRAEETKPAKIALRWRYFFTHVAIPAYDRWEGASNLSRQFFWQRRYLEVKMAGMQRRVQELFAKNYPDKASEFIGNWGK